MIFTEELIIILIDSSGTDNRPASIGYHDGPVRPQSRTDPPVYPRIGSGWNDWHDHNSLTPGSHTPGDVCELKNPDYNEMLHDIRDLILNEILDYESPTGFSTVFDDNYLPEKLR